MAVPSVVRLLLLPKTPPIVAPKTVVVVAAGARVFGAGCPVRPLRVNLEYSGLEKVVPVQ